MSNRFYVQEVAAVVTDFIHVYRQGCYNLRAFFDGDAEVFTSHTVRLFVVLRGTIWGGEHPTPAGTLYFIVLT